MKLVSSLFSFISFLKKELESFRRTIKSCSELRLQHMTCLITLDPCYVELRRELSRDQVRELNFSNSIAFTGHNLLI